MKTKIKRHSRSVLSVVLTLCMLVSCITVGLITTDAAQVTDSEAVGATGTVYADGNLKGDGDWISLPMYYDTASGNYYCPARIKDGGEWKFHDSSAKYGSQSDNDSDRDISQYGGVSSNYEVVTSGRESTFRLKKGSTVDCTVWLKGDLTRTWVTEGKTAPPTVTVSLAANPTNVTATVTNNSSTTITAGSSGSLVIGSESTINVTVDPSVSSTKKAVSATVTTSDSSETVYFSSNGNGTYTATFTVPDKNATVTVNSLEDKQTYKVKVVANDPSYGSVSVTSAGGAAYSEYLRYAEDTAIVLSATAAADHPFQSWDKGTDKTNAAATYYVNGNDADEDNDEVITITAIFKTNYYKASSTIVGDTGKIYQGVNARFFDYYYDKEVKDGWLSYGENEAKNDNRQPYTILNQALKTYAKTNNVLVPLYFGNMYTNNNDVYDGMYGYQTPTSITGVTSGQNSLDYHFYWAASNSNGIKALYGGGNNYNYGHALTGLSGKSLNSSGNITHVSDKDSRTADDEVEMKLFDKDWLTSRSGPGYAYTGPLATIIDSPFPFVKETIKRLYFENTGNYTHVYTWSDSNGRVQHNGDWPGTPLLTDPVTGKKYINVSTDAEHFILSHDNGGNGKQSADLNTNWDNGNCYNLDNSNWTTVADDDKGNYYSFDSKDGQDNAYFTGIRNGEVSPVMNYYKNRNKVKDRGTPQGYGFFPYDGNLAGTNSAAQDYGYGMRMDIEFTLGENGKNALGQDQIFKFSGDDDLWVYVDGNLVLDLGGAHGRSQGEINFGYTNGVNDASATANNTTVTVNNPTAYQMYSKGQNVGTNTTALPPVHYTSDSEKGVTRNTTASVDRTKQKHTLTIFYMERGKEESNLKIGFSFSPVANDFVAEKDLNLNRVSADEDFKTAVERLANSDQFTFNNSWSATSDGTFNAPASGLESTFTHNGASSVKTTGGTTQQIPDASTKFTAGDSDSFVGKFTVGQYFKLTETPDSSNKFNYDDRLIVTDMAQNDKRLTPVDAENGIYKFDTVKTNPNYEIDPVLLKATHINTLKTRSLTIKKEINGDPDSTTAFPIQVKIKLDKTAADLDANYVAYRLPYVTSGGASGTLDENGKVSLHQDETITIEGIPEKASVRVSEPDALTNYYHQVSCVVTDSDNTSVTTTSITNGQQFAIGSKNINVVITNTQEAKKSFTIKKEMATGSAAETGNFTIKVETSTDGSNWTALANAAFTTTDTTRGTNGTGTLDGSGETTIKADEILTFTDLVNVNTYIRVAEAKAMPADNSYVSIAATVGGSPAEVTEYDDTAWKGGYFLLTDAAAVIITNEKIPNIKYVIVYNFPSRSHVIGNNVGQPKYGNLSYTVEGSGKPADILANDKISKALVQEKVPYEKNFMQDMDWKFDNITYPTTNEPSTDTDGVKVYHCTVNAVNKDIPTVKVVFYFPYASTGYVIRDFDSSVSTNTERGTIYGPDGTPTSLGEYTTQSYVNQVYQSNPVVYAKRIRQVDDGNGGTKNEEYDEKFCTFAADSVDGKKFAYWSIRSINRNDPGTEENPNYVEVARCYESRFNYTLFDNYRVYAMYEGQADVDPTPETTAAYTTINFLEYSRNHWNKGANGTYPTYTNGDAVWTDFDVAFENGTSLLNNSSTEVGVLVERVQDNLDNGVALDPAAADYAVNYKHYVDKYSETADTWRAYASNYILSTELKKNARTANDQRVKTVLNTQLTNKNRMEFGFALFVNDGSDANTAKKNGLYRAYTYMRVKDGESYKVILCDTPVYFCVQNEANKVKS